MEDKAAGRDSKDWKVYIRSHSRCRANAAAHKSYSILRARNHPHCYSDNTVEEATT